MQPLRARLLYRPLGVDVPSVTEHARERLGMEIQAATLFRPCPVGDRCPEVWSLMTERGSFWLVEEAGAVELFRATREGGALGHALAVKRFLELHPRAWASAPPDHPAPSPAPSTAFHCRRCEAPVSLNRQSRAADPGLCTRCARAERQRLRYQSDPEYRARRARHAAAVRHQKARQGDGA